MKIDIHKLSEAAQKEMLAQFSWDVLKGLLRLAELPAQKTKRAAAEALVDSGKLITSCTYYVGLRTDTDPKFVEDPKPDGKRMRELQAWNDSIEIVNPEEEIVRDVVARQEDDIVIDEDTPLEEDEVALPISVPLRQMIRTAAAG